MVSGRKVRMGDSVRRYETAAALPNNAREREKSREISRYREKSRDETRLLEIPHGRREAGAT